MNYARLAAAGVHVLEVDGTAIEFEIATPAGVVAIMADMVVLEDRLILDRTHVTAQGLTIGIIRTVAKAFGEAEDVGEVIIQGGDRGSGAKPGSRPTPIRVRVKQ